MESAEAVYAFFEVVIVGGGIAGLSAADMLYKNGITSFTILEARSRLGGRMYSEEIDDGKFIDYGAQYVHGGVPANSIYNLAVSNDLLGDEPIAESVENLKNFYTSEGKIIDEYHLQKAWELFAPILEAIKYYEENEEIPSEYNNIEVAFEEGVYNAIENLKASNESENYFIEDVELALRTMRFALEVPNGDKNGEVGLGYYYVELGGGDLVIPAGSQSIIKTFGNEIVSRVKMNTVVNRIEWNDNEVTTFTCEGDVIKSKHVIVTLPLGVLKQESVQFVPPLDDRKKTAIENLGQGREIKMILLFDKPFWLPGNGYMVFAWTEQELAAGIERGDWTTGISIMTEIIGIRNALTTFVVGDFAEVVEKLTDDEIIEGVAQVLRKFTKDMLIPTPTEVKRHNWLSDPFTLGTWVYPTPKTNYTDYAALQIPLPSEETPRVLLAGEHTHGKYSSTMHGARNTGVDQANKIIQYMKNKN